MKNQIKVPLNMIPATGTYEKSTTLREEANAIVSFALALSTPSIDPQIFVELNRKAEMALEFIRGLYRIEREVKELSCEERLAIRQTRSKPVAQLMYKWLMAHRPQISDGSAGAKAMDYTIKRWTALTRFLDDGQLPIDNNLIENAIRPIALGRSNWLFAGSLRAGKRSAAIMSLIQSAKMNGHDPYLYLKDVLERLPTHKNHLIHELLPHRWQPQQ